MIDFVRESWYIDIQIFKQFEYVQHKGFLFRMQRDLKILIIFYINIFIITDTFWATFHQESTSFAN